MDITVKFTIATEQGTDTLMMLTEQIALEKFSQLVDAKILAGYIEENFSEKVLISELNSLSNQWLVVYVDEKPAGYARITSKGKMPESLYQKRSIRIADFGIRSRYSSDPAIRKSLIDKCLEVCKSHDAIWINEYSDSPLLPFFESEGFLRDKIIYGYDDLPLRSVVLIKNQE
ncbi:hypothetical protein [Chryseobacterium gregarium]|uniref:hypothetical protein n=1 Tax=Chryseobacterium gregarium TaxID=456299 RepID=UPI00040264BF|nr:hypothetical protein [Chryseobacterium gregarium]